MGYYTRYNGSLAIEPILTVQERDRLAQLVGIELSHAKDVFNPVTPPTAEDAALLKSEGVSSDSLWAWAIELNQLICPEDDVKGYSTVEGLSLAHKWLKDKGHTLNGEISWAGESNDDSGTIYVDPEHGVEAVSDVRENPGPSWKPTLQSN